MHSTGLRVLLMTRVSPCYRAFRDGVGITLSSRLQVECFAGFFCLVQCWTLLPVKAQELCKSRGGRPGLPVLMNIMVSVDVKQQRTKNTRWSQFVHNIIMSVNRYPRTLSSATSSLLPVLAVLPHLATRRPRAELCQRTGRTDTGPSLGR